MIQSCGEIAKHVVHHAKITHFAVRNKPATVLIKPALQVDVPTGDAAWLTPAHQPTASAPTNAKYSRRGGARRSLNCAVHCG